MKSKLLRQHRDKTQGDNAITLLQHIRDNALKGNEALVRMLSTRYKNRYGSSPVI